MKNWITYSCVLLALFSCGDKDGKKGDKSEFVPNMFKAEDKVDVKNVPKDDAQLLKEVRTIPDYSDKPFLPIASHGVQFFEWLGLGVTEEKGPLPQDKFDDGVVVLNPFNLAPGKKVNLLVTISTRYQFKPNDFPKGSYGTLGIWIDWNHNKKFEKKTEQVFVSKLDIPLVVKGKKYAQYVLKIPVLVPKNYKGFIEKTKDGRYVGVLFPAIRARVGFYEKTDKPQQPSPDLYELYGEVEDHERILNDHALVTRNYRRLLHGRNMLVNTYDEKGKLMKTMTSDSLVQEEVELVFSSEENDAVFEFVDEEIAKRLKQAPTSESYLRRIQEEEEGL